IPTCPLGFAMWDLIRRPNNGLRAGHNRTSSPACATDLDGSVRSQPADVRGALTSNDVIQILLETPASRPAIAKLIGRIHENDNLAQIAYRKFGGDGCGTRPRRQARSRPGRADPHRRHL